MVKSLRFKPLGAVLEQAGLVSATQIETALKEQPQFQDLRIGEVLALHGWIKPETADFFAQRWPTLQNQRRKQPLGQYLKEAALLNEAQIQEILTEQKRTGRKFGEIAIFKGWVQKRTIEFFLNYLAPEYKSNLTVERLMKSWRSPEESNQIKAIRDRLLNNTQCSPFWLLKLYQNILQGEVRSTDSLEQAELISSGLVVEQQGILKVAPAYQSVFDQNWVKKELAKLKPFKKNGHSVALLEAKADSLPKVVDEVLIRTNQQPFLSQTLFHLINHSEFIPHGQEATRVEQLVQTYLVNDWEHGEAAEHLKDIENRLLEKDGETGRLLRVYQQVLQQTALVNVSEEQQQLLELGLVVNQQGKLQVANKIYESVFEQRWVEDRLARLRPYHNVKLMLEEKADYPYTVMTEVLSWTNRHAWLTQKLYQIIAQTDLLITAGQEAKQVEELVQTRIIEHWETGAAAEHLTNIRDRLLDKDQKSGKLLRMYQHILYGDIAADYRWEQQELLKLGLVDVHDGNLLVFNRIYEHVFNASWINRELEKLNPPLEDAPPQPLPAKPRRVPKRLNLHKINRKRLLIPLGAASVLLGLLWVFSQVFFHRLEVKTLFEQGNERFGQGDYEAALAKYDQVLHVDGNYYQAWTNRGYALAGLQEYSKMLESCRAATIIEPQATYAWNCKGEALHNLEQYDEAIAAFEQAVELNPTDPIFFINKGESLQAVGQVDEALADINQAIKLLQQQPKEGFNRDLAIALSSKGRIFREQQQYQAAIAVFDQALLYEPNYFPAQRDRALALRSLGEYQQARDEFTQILNHSQLTDAQAAEIWFYQGLTLCDLWQSGAAIAAFNEALRLKPDYQAAQAAKERCW